MKFTPESFTALKEAYTQIGDLYEDEFFKNFLQILREISELDVMAGQTAKSVAAFADHASQYQGLIREEMKLLGTEIEAFVEKVNEDDSFSAVGL
ncbi:MAG: hypothetical protein FWG14_07685 [Peptococcaceae bacterium]|nr:hypothetical protein [Peptococcaceae bacterium]